MTNDVRKDRKDIEALTSVLDALEPLESNVREWVLKSVLSRLGIQLSKLQSTGEPPADIAKQQDTSQDRILPPDKTIKSIRDLKEEKAPKSANEMAVLVAYYLANEAPANERKETVTTKDLEKYFKMARFRLPSKIQYTLANTKNSGYIEALGKGRFRLNAVGHNLVVHNMPTKTEAAKPSRKRKKKAPKKSNKK